MRRAIKRILMWYFSLIPTPHGFGEVMDSDQRVLLVTQGRSLILESLLSALSKRFQRGETTYLSSDQLASQSLLQMNYFSLNDFESLEEIAGRLRSSPLLFRYSVLNIFRSKGPLVSRPSYQMRTLDYAILLLSPILHCRFFLILLGEVKTLPSHSRVSVGLLSRKLKLSFHENVRMVRGTPFQSFAAQRRIVLGGRSFEQQLEKLSDESGVSLQQLRKRAAKLFSSMAARPISLIYIPTAVVLRFLLRRMFSDIRAAGLDRVAKSLRKDTVILVPLHRSHLDYLILSWLLYNANLNTPLIAAGINLSFWPFGPIIRSLGGYFVRRNAQEDSLNSLVLSRYVSYLVRRGHLQKFFIEGGRSRSGRMRAPKLGLLQIMVETYLRREKRDIVFVPVAITYEQVVEESELASENTGKEKIEENLRSLFRARSFLKENHKEVLVHFGEPIRLSEFERAHHQDQQLTRKLGLQLTRDIRDYCAVSLRALTCTALSLSPRYALFQRELTGVVIRLAEIARLHQTLRGRADMAAFSPSLQRFLDRAGQGELDVGHIVSREQLGSTTLLFVPGSKRFTADFYRNGVLHLFVPLGLFSISQLLYDEVRLDRLKPLADLLRADLLLPDWDEYQKELEHYQQILEKQGLLHSDSGALTLTSDTLGDFCPSLLLGQIQSYRWVLSLLATFRNSEVVDYDTFQELIKDKTILAKYLGATDRTESRALTSLQSALEALNAVGILEFERENGRRSLIRVLRPFQEESALLSEIDLRTREWSLAFEQNFLFGVVGPSE